MNKKIQNEPKSISMCEGYNTVTLLPQDKTARKEYDNTLKALENIWVLLIRFSI